MLKIALTGSTGLVGSRIIQLLSNDFQFIPLSHKEFDIINKTQVSSVLSDLEYDIFLHLAAFTNVDGAETSKDIAYKINADGTKNIFDAVSLKNKKFIYISTDFVFDGKNPSYNEDSIPNPISVYGASKFEGEKIVKDKAMIVRISYPYRLDDFVGKKDFVKTIKDLLIQEKIIKMVTDSLITPTFTDDIAYGLKHLLNNYSPEIYHLVGAESLSPYDAGNRIARKYGLNEELIQPIEYDQYFSTKAKRPKYSKITSKKNNFRSMSTFLS